MPTYRESASPASASPAAPANQASSAWPVVFNKDSTTYTVYEPQPDSWDGHQLTARSAVAVQSPGEAQRTYGVMTFNALTLVDKSSRTASLADIKVASVNFPSAPGQDQRYGAAIQQDFPKQTATVSLDSLQPNFNAAEEQPKPEPLNNTPPKVFVDTRPAVLVYVDGPPVLKPVSGTSLERVINTRMLLLKDNSGKYYLHLFDGYVEASSLQGPWAVASQPPPGADQAEAQATNSGQVDLLKGEADNATHKLPSLTTTVTPDVFVATTPSELITFNGSPNYVPIDGTQLLYAANTTGNVFKSLADQNTYILISGRWYRANSLEGPWQYVPGSQLPHDFANIPDNSPKENVKASVPGTEQAEEALIANSIPQSTAVSRSEQMQSPQIDGAPRIAPLAGTPLQYVVNSSTPIIEVDSHSWYACQNGVWYVGTSPTGPWAVTASVPAVIYSIPPSSPLHYVTYVHVYDSTPQVVYEGYTPGYFGTEVCDDGTVVYGTGYYYSPWVGTVWYGPPVTWGCGFADCWTPWWGWDFDCGFGWDCYGFGWWGCPPPFPWWGGFRDWDHDHDDHDHDWHEWRGGEHAHGFTANTGANIYHHGPAGGSDRGRFAANGHDSGRSGWGRTYGNAYNSRTGQLAAGEHARVQSVNGSAWRPANRSGSSWNNTSVDRGRAYGMNRSGGWANGSSRFGQRQFTPPNSYSGGRDGSYPRGFGEPGRSYYGWDRGAASPSYGNSRAFGGHSGGGWFGGGRGYSHSGSRGYSGGGGSGRGNRR